MVLIENKFNDGYVGLVKHRELGERPYVLRWGRHDFTDPCFLKLYGGEMNSAGIGSRDSDLEVVLRLSSDTFGDDDATFVIPEVKLSNILLHRNTHLDIDDNKRTLSKYYALIRNPNYGITINLTEQGYGSLMEKEGNSYSLAIDVKKKATPQ